MNIERSSNNTNIDKKKLPQTQYSDRVYASFFAHTCTAPMRTLRQIHMAWRRDQREEKNTPRLTTKTTTRTKCINTRMKSCMHAKWHKFTTTKELNIYEMKEEGRKKNENETAHTPTVQWSTKTNDKICSVGPFNRCENIHCICTGLRAADDNGRIIMNFLQIGLVNGSRPWIERSKFTCFPGSCVLCVFRVFSGSIHMHGR